MDPVFTRPSTQALLAFEGADLFGESDADSVTCGSALECLEELLEQSDMEHDGVEAWLGGEAPLSWTIAAYKREDVSAAQIDTWAEWQAESLRDNYGDEGCGDEEGDDRLSDEEQAELVRRMREVVAWYVTKAACFRCEQLKTFHLDSGDIRELVEQLRPEWLNRPEVAPSNKEPTP